MLIAAILIVLFLVLVWAGYGISQSSKSTAEKLRQYEDSIDISTLSGADRAAALRKLAEKINELPLEERRKSRLEPEWRQWFDKMTENEKGQFIEATLPTGFKQWLNVFDNLPENKRKTFIDAAMKQLKSSHQFVTDREPGEDKSMYGTNGVPTLSPSLWQKAQAVGLRTFYSESSAEAKAELAPFLEELQHQMQTGKLSK